VFAEAEDSNAIIFFDEADALFGKRGEVKEARDRWANIEVNYLLQRVEEFAGWLSWLLTCARIIDESFLRRVHVVVEFPFPETDARRQIWLGMFPDDVLHPGEDKIGILADQFRLAGGSIRNIVIDAAFRAQAEADRLGERPPEITLRHLVLGTAREYQKLGKPLTKGEFGEDFYAWVREGILIEPREERKMAKTKIQAGEQIQPGLRPSSDDTNLIPDKGGGPAGEVIQRSVAPDAVVVSPTTEAPGTGARRWGDCESGVWAAGAAGRARLAGSMQGAVGNTRMGEMLDEAKGVKQVAPLLQRKEKNPAPKKSRRRSQCHYPQKLYASRRGKRSLQLVKSRCRLARQKKQEADHR